MIKLLLYGNILIITLTLYVSKYLNYKFRERMDRDFPHLLEKKKREIRYSNYDWIICTIDLVSTFSVITLAIIFTNAKALTDIIRNEIDTLVWKSIINYILIGILITFIIFFWIKDERQIIKDEMTYDIQYVRGPLSGLILPRVHGIFITPMNILDLFLYQYFSMKLSYVYCVFIISFLIILLNLQWIKRVDQVLKKQNIIKTIILIIGIILVVFLLDYIILGI